jgi:hypothetical protein
MVFNKQSLAKGITLAASILANEIRKITSVGGVGGYPKEIIPPSITVGTATVTDTGASIGITTENKGDDNARVTLAFELGSGLFGKEGQKYKIKPKNANLLAFMWKDAASIGVREGVKEVVDKTGKAILPWVMHPGIKPNPFLQRSIDASSDRMLEIIGQNFEYQILDGPRVEVIK